MGAAGPTRCGTGKQQQLMLMLTCLVRGQGKSSEKRGRTSPASSSGESLFVCILCHLLLALSFLGNIFTTSHHGRQKLPHTLQHLLPQENTHIKIPPTSFSSVVTIPKPSPFFFSHPKNLPPNAPALTTLPSANTTSQSAPSTASFLCAIVITVLSLNSSLNSR